jgi:1A family penicillin-binding protein
MTARTRKIRHTAKPRAGKYIALGFVVILLALLVALVTAGVSLARSWLEDLPDYSDTDAYLLAEPTKVLDADGNLIAEFYMENRIPITIDECSQWVLLATVDVEDERFYSHNGVDIKGIARAVVSQITGGSEGASTITQQLVRNTVLKDEQFEKTLSRKVREAYIAVELEKMYTKDEILLMYLNSIFYGQGCYGIEAAAETYFGKTCAELSLAEAALLAGIPQSPSVYNPLVNPDLAIERRNVVLAAMLRNGDITQDQYDEAVATTLELNYTPRQTSGDAYAYPYFVDYVRDQLSKQFSTDIIFKGGLTVKTTISPYVQSCAENAVSEVLGQTDDDLEAALVCIDPHTGYIRAMVGGSDYDVSVFNLATSAKRQPGSAFKTFTLAAAIEQGLSPDVAISGASPLTLQVSADETWTVNNYEYVSYGSVSLRQATWSSINTVYAQIIDEIGAANVADVAYRMGITTTLDAVDSLTLGTTGCTVLEMASAYGTLATGGTHYEPVAIESVLDRNGNVLYQYEPVGSYAISPEVAAAVTDILEGVVSDYSWGTGTAAALTVDQPLAGKTGTTDDRKDLWFVGYTPQYVAAVWVGYRDREDTIYFNGTYGKTQTLPNPIFSKFMSAALAGVERAEFPSAATPSYRSNWDWSFSLGTWTEPVYEEEEDEEEDVTYDDVTVTEPESWDDGWSDWSEPTYDDVW